MTKLWPGPRDAHARSRLTVAVVVAVLCGAVAVGALAQGMAAALIGKLEGPEVVTDPAQFPRASRRRRSWPTW